ncbi:MAG: alpha-glucosidase C-terminal domain-containing protein [Melioribacteraceae bacterium]|nr:alpha-glucosidase C-terminal domain-containing protein [Melioribacteraceae bacterium]
MSTKLIRLLHLLLVNLLLIGCSGYSENEIGDIIAPITLTSGKSKQIVVQDIFYTEKHEIFFKNNDQLSINYNSGNDTITIIPNPGFDGITSLNFEFDDNMYDIPLIVKKEKLYEFSFKPDKDYEELTLFGSFNGWNRHDIFMNDEDGNGVFTASAALEPGVYQYKFFGDGEEIVDPLNPQKVPNGFGSFNSVRIIEENDVDKLFLHIDTYDLNSIRGSYSFIAEYKNRSALLPEEVFAYLDNNQIDDKYLEVKGSRIIIHIPREELGDNDLLRVIISKNGRISNMQYVFLFDGEPASNENFTWYDGIIYSLMIDRFNDGDKSLNKPVQHDSLLKKANYMGGDLQGVIDKLNEGYFTDLGINTLWISPVYDNPEEAFREYPAPHRYYSGYHGYWPISPDKVENRFGDLAKLKELVKTAHNKNIKVLLDFVSNHTHEQHPYFKENRNWYGQLELPNGELNLRKWDEYRLTTWFEPYLPSFDYLGSPEAVEAITNNAVWWLKQTDADGYRHDAVKHVPNLFWRELNKKIREQVAAHRDFPVFQIGETFGSYELISSYVNNGQLSSQFNFNLYDVAIPTFIEKNSSFDRLDKEMNKTFSIYGNIHLMGNVMDSHDKNRFMAYADGDLDVSEWSAVETGWNNPPVVDNPDNYKKLNLYYAYMNTIPGLPVIYYGSEFGMSGASDPDNRRMMRFGNQLSEAEKRTLSENRKIINLREQHTALRYGDFYTLQADENIYAYMRSDMYERLLIVLNKSATEQNIDIRIPIYYEVKELKSLYDTSIVVVTKNSCKVVVNGNGWQIYSLN